MRRQFLWLKVFLLCVLLSVGFNQGLVVRANINSAQITVTSGLDETDTLVAQDKEKAGSTQADIDGLEAALLLSDSAIDRAKILGYLAIAYEQTGQYANAIERNQAAIALFIDLGEAGAVGKVYNSLGNVYKSLGQYEKAIAAYRQSLVIARSLNQREDEGIVLGNLGYLYSLRGDRLEGLRMLKQSLAIARERGDRQSEAIRLLNIGTTLHGLEDLVAAADAFRLSLAIARSLEHPAIEAQVLVGLASVIAEDGQLDEAIRALTRSLEIARTMRAPVLVATVSNNLSHTLLAANRLDEAEMHLQEAVQILDRLRSGLTDAENVSLLDTQTYTYNLLTQVLVKKGSVEAALASSEAGRARAFTDIMMARSDFLVGEPSRGNSTTPPPSIRQIRQIAKDRNATLIEYALVPEETFRAQGRQRGRTAEIYMWVVRPNGDIHFVSKSVDVENHSLEGLLASFRSAFGSRSGLYVEVDGVSSYETVPKNLSDLYQVLIDPIQQWLPESPEDNIVFIPQGELFLVPFAALINAQGRFFIENHTPVVSSSIPAIALTQKRQVYLNTSTNDMALENANQRNPAPLIVGDPEMHPIRDARLNQVIQLDSLPNARDEALAIAEDFGVAALTGLAASEQAVKARIQDARIVHLATHGLLDYGDPDSTSADDTPGALVLAIGDDGDGQDGLLTSAEIRNDMRLSADLVVLSACDTGRGTLSTDGVDGLARTLIASGASSVIVSLWAVPDAPTASLMIDFYRELNLGKSKAQALRLAMLETIKTHSSPQNWAAFTLIGAMS